MQSDHIQAIVDEATFDYTMGDHDVAIQKLNQLVKSEPDAFEAWHALAEIHFNLRQFDLALTAAEQGLRVRPDDLFINTTLSRVWMEKGDKAMAEKFGAKAKVLSWKDQLKNPEEYKPGAM